MSEKLEMAVILPAETAKSLRGVFGCGSSADDDGVPVGAMRFRSTPYARSKIFEVIVHDKHGYRIVAQVEAQWMAEAIIKAAVAAKMGKVKGK